MNYLIEKSGWETLPWPTSAFTVPEYQAHRGYWVGGATENSLDAIAEAKAKNYEMFECDVQLTKDLVPVLFHDEGTGRFLAQDILIRDLNFSELKEMLPEVPSFEDVLKASHRPDHINIELKTAKFFEAHLESRVSALLKKYKMQDQVLISSFNPFSLWMCSQFLPETPRALLATLQDGDRNNWILKNMLLAPFAKVHMLNLNHEDYSSMELSKYIAEGMRISLWTVNDLERAEEELENGVISIISDLLGSK